MMLKIIIIVLSVTVFGVLFFLFVKRALKKKLDEYVFQSNKKNKKKPINY